MGTRLPLSAFVNRGLRIPSALQGQPLMYTFCRRARVGPRRVMLLAKPVLLRPRGRLFQPRGRHAAMNWLTI